MEDQDCRSGLEYIKVQNKRLIFKCLRCNKSHKKNFKEDFTKRLNNTYNFCDGDIKKRSLPLRIYGQLGKTQENNTTNIKKFYSNLTIEENTHKYYEHVKRFRRDLEFKKLGDYHDFYVESDTLLLAGIFENL